MGGLFWIFSYLAGYFAIMLVALSISAGLYLLSELAEEYPSSAGKIIKYLLISVVILQVIFCIDGLPVYESVITLLSYGIYATMLRSFPFVKLVSIESVLSVLAFFFTNIVWIRHFVDEHIYETLQIFGFFTIMIWSVPCCLFISISLSEHTLPNLSLGGMALHTSEKGLTNYSYTPDDTLGGGSGGKKKSIFKSLFDAVMGWLDGLNLGFPLLNPMKMLGDKRK